MSNQSKTAGKAIDLLFVLAEVESATPQQLSRKIDENRTVVQRMLSTLLIAGLVDREEGEYSLTSKVWKLAAGVKSRVLSTSNPLLARAANSLNETVVLLSLDGDHAVVLSEHVSECAGEIRVRNKVATRHPLVQSASGIAILSQLSAAKMNRVIAKYATSEPQVREQVALCKSRGYARSSDALQDGVSGIAVPLGFEGELMGCVSMIVPSTRARVLETSLPEMLKLAQDISDAVRAEPV